MGDEIGRGGFAQRRETQKVQQQPAPQVGQAPEVQPARGEIPGGVVEADQYPYLAAAEDEVRGISLSHAGIGDPHTSWALQEADALHDDGTTQNLASRAHDSSDRSTPATERGQNGATSELGRRSPAGTGNDGSGDWGRETPTRTDEYNHAQWARIADMAELVGYTNAARHMRHYLDNTGAPLEVDVEALLDQAPLVDQKCGDLVEDARDEVFLRISSGDPTQDHSFMLTGSVTGAQADKGDSPDWYYAIGKMDVWYDATAQYASNGDGTGVVELDFVFNIFDNYNWDAKKWVTILGVKVMDEQVGRLHVVGLGQEYVLWGDTGSLMYSYAFDGNDMDLQRQPEAVDASSTGSRSDVGRERS